MGQNLQDAFCVTALRYGAGNEPHALHTALGWALWGNDHLNSENCDVGLRLQVNCILEQKPVCEEILNVLHQDFKDIDLPEDIEMSRDDKRAMAIFEESVTKESGHYKIALPWKEDYPVLPNNRGVAENRLKGLTRKLLLDLQLRDKGQIYLIPLLGYFCVSGRNLLLLLVTSDQCFTKCWLERMIVML